MSDDWNLPSKPYDLRERLFQFACVIVRVVEFLHIRGPVAKALSYQVLKAGTSAGSNYEEADGPVINESDELVRIVATLVKKGPSGK